MKKLILCSFILLATSSVLRAEAVTFEATVNSSQVSLDEVLQLTLTITGANDNLDPVSLPVLDAFSVKYVGPSTSVSIINGNYHSERSFVYNLFPNKVGHFQIPSISATIAGQTYTTKLIDVEVIQNSSQARALASGQSSDGNQSPSLESFKDKILMMISVDKTNVYVNERVILSIKLLVNDVPIRDIQYPQFEKKGFLIDDFDKPQQASEVINGVKYDTVEFKTYIYPDHPGDLQVGPAQIQGNILYKTGQTNPFDQDSGFMGANVFNDFFDSYATRPVSVQSKVVSLHVLPIPEDNRPQDFSGAIGQFNFQASVAPQQVKVGDPLTLKMQISGTGNLKGFKIPVFQAPGFKSYEPQIKDVGGQKTAEEVIIPTSADVKEVPALHFSYFDTSIKDYKTITQGPFAIQVMVPPPEQEFKAVGFSDVSKEQVPAVLVNQYSFDKILNKINQFSRKLCQSMWFWFSLGLISMAGVSFVLWQRFQDRLLHDPAFARRIKAFKEAREALNQAEQYIPTGKTKDFYALMSKVLREYLANKWHLSSAVLSVDEILNHLRIAKLDEAHSGQIKSILEQSDLVCFAGANRDASQMKSDLAQTQNLIAFLEQHLK